MNHSLLSFYKQCQEEYQSKLSRLDRRYRLISFSRLLVFVLGIALTWFLFDVHSGLALTAGGLMLIGFVALIQLHTQLNEERQYLQALVKINRDEIAALGGNVEAFDLGQEFVDPKHAYSFDLDFFGRASVFQYINRTCSIMGKHRLAEWLQVPPLDRDEILARQEAIGDLAKRPDFSQKFQALGQGKLESAEEPKSILNWLREPVSVLNNRWYQILMILLPVLLLISIAGWIAATADAMEFLRPFFNGRLPVLLIIVNLLVVGTHLNKTNQQQVQLGRKSRMLDKYASLLGAVENQDFSASRMLELQSRLSTDKQTASDAIDRLATIMSYLDQRLNMVAGLFLNATVLWDLQCISRLEKWKQQYQDELPRWFDAVGDTDALNSWGRFAHNHPEFIFPEVAHDPFRLAATELGHFLIRPDVRVCNDVKMRKPGEFLIITGANMAGKSTFLRTMGVNLIVAMNGAPVCAKSYTFVPIPMMTSVRAMDSLEDNESYFYAELVRLKAIINLLREKGSLFIIVDEMLRGTNSRDKQTGSRKFIEQLMQLNGVGLIATHDLSLGNLAEEYPELAQNKRFEVDILEDRLEFDYKLKDGISQNLNATFLMQQMGIMP